jgi:hypothetical protein
MKVTVKNKVQGHLFDEIKVGEVFYSAVDPDHFCLRTISADGWAAVDLETGTLYHYDDFDHDDAQYYIVEAEVSITS